MNILNESLDYLDMEGQLSDKVTIDEYAAKMGKDKDVVTITFKTNSKLAAKDLTSWFERGYDWVLDASVSDGEIEPGKYLVFVEIQRRSKVPSRIIQLLSDLETLTGFELADWNIDIDGEKVDADESALRNAIICNPNEYEEVKEIDSEEEINEFRELAGLETKTVYEDDEYTRNLKAMAGM